MIISHFAKAANIPLSRDPILAVTILILCAWVIYLKRNLNTKITQLKSLHERLNTYALIDPLTELYNYRYFSRRLKETLNQASRNHFSVSILKIDITFFKSINKIYGSLKGDAILKEFSKFLKETVRGSDMVSRLGDDEFGIICNYTEQKEALKLAKRIKKNLNLCYFGNEKINLQISIGLVTYPNDGNCGETLLSLLDKCLDCSKERCNKIVNLEVFKNSNDHIEDTLNGNGNLQELKTRISELKTMVDRTTVEAIIAFANTIKAKDLYTAEHAGKTVEIAVAIGKQLNLDEPQIEALRYAAMLHDLGKVAIPEAILLKPGKLTDQEFKKIKKHSIIGSEILRPLHSLAKVIPSILYHHEWIDGSGYPYGLKAEQIPIEAKIVALADSFQALTSDRPYRKAFSLGRAKEIIDEETGTHFDPNVVDAFRKFLKSQHFC